MKKEKVMAPETLTKLVTYDDYRHLPNDGKQYQIIEGELHMTPAPSTYHQKILFKLAQILDNYVENEEKGEVLIAPVDVVLSMTDVVQPDIIFVSKGRLNIITKKNIVEAPDLVVEILSERSETIDRIKKKALYEQHGVKEYWIVDPDSKSIERFELDEETLKLQDTITSDEDIHSGLLPNFNLKTSEIF